MISTPRVSEKPRILVAEDEAEVRSYLEVALRCLGYAVDSVEDGEEVLSCLKDSASNYSLLLLDLMMPRKDGLETLREIRQFDTGLPIIMLSGAASPLNVVAAIKSGSNDFLAKPISPEELNRAIQKALPAGNRTTPATVRRPGRAESTCMASSPWTKKLDVFLKQVGSSDVPVLLQGETGAGKEMLARQLHASSPRARGPFLKLNCAALPSELIESELFGYERGAFTGAFRNTPGKFEMANSGTILLDEIGDMEFKLQAKLLQVLQDGEFLRLGAKETCKVDVRVIAATHCDLERAIQDGRFREDLYYRLNIIRIEVPPLRDRREEIIPLAHFFLNKHSRPAEPEPEITPQLAQALLSHSWPGNIRELENVMRKFLVLRRADMIVADLALPSTRTRPRQESLAPREVPTGIDRRIESRPNAAPTSFVHSDRRSASDSLESSRPASHTRANSANHAAGEHSILGKVNEEKRLAEIAAIEAALNAVLWNRKQAAHLLKVEYKALLYKMKKLGMGSKMSAGSS